MYAGKVNIMLMRTFTTRILIVVSAGVVVSCANPSDNLTKEIAKKMEADCIRQIRAQLINPESAAITVTPQASGNGLDAPVVITEPDTGIKIFHGFVCVPNQDGEVTARLLAG